MKAALLFTLTAVVLPLLLAEFGDWCPWLAVRIVRWSARRLGDPTACARYEEEWVANLNEVPGKLSRLVAAFGYLACLPQMRWALRRSSHTDNTSSTSFKAPVVPLDVIPASEKIRTGRRVVLTPDGRRLSTTVYGDPDGKPVFLLHGTPGSRLGPHPRSAVLHRLGVQLISFDRPGYGESDRLEGRRVADAAADVRAIADEFGLGKFAVVGRSGGGPHALACAALLPDRLTKTAVVVGMAPREVDGLDWFDGMTQFNGLGDNQASRETNLFDPDHRGDLADRDIRSMLLQAYTEARRSSAEGWIDDALAFYTPWGFEPGSVTNPVLLWHGAIDNLSPGSHALWLADRIPSATVVVQAGAAHYGALDVLPNILTWLTA